MKVLPLIVPIAMMAIRCSALDANLPVTDPNYHWDYYEYRQMWGCVSYDCNDTGSAECTTDDGDDGCLYSRPLAGNNRGGGQDNNEGCVLKCFPESQLNKYGGTLSAPTNTITKGPNVWAFGFSSCNNNRRLLTTHEKVVTKEDALKVIEEKGGNPFGTFATKDDIISKESIQILKQYTDNAYDHDDFDASKLPSWRMDFAPGTHRPYLPPEAQGNYKISGYELIQLIGKDDVKSLLEFFHEALGEGTPVTSITLQIGHNDEMFHYEPHVDLKKSMIVFLGGNNGDVEDGIATWERGGLGYYDNNGYTVVHPAPGKAVAHSLDTVHQSEPFKGDRYIIDIQSAEKDIKFGCLLKKFFM